MKVLPYFLSLSLAVWFVSFVPNAMAATSNTSCPVTTLAPSCSFDCNLGAAIAVSAAGPEGEIMGSCGGATADCAFTTTGCVGSSSTTTGAAGTGTCTLTGDGTGSCAAAGGNGNGGSDGVGVCVVGFGFDSYDNFDGTPLDGVAYVGVNVASPIPVNLGSIPVTLPDPVGTITLFPNGFVLGGSTTGIYRNPTDFETQCCAETGLPPDCFAPIE